MAFALLYIYYILPGILCAPYQIHYILYIYIRPTSVKSTRTERKFSEGFGVGMIYTYYYIFRASGMVEDAEKFRENGRIYLKRKKCF